MTTSLTPETVVAMAAKAGHPVSLEDAQRIVAAIGPALCVFAEVEASLPFEAEPGRFACVQMQGVQQS